MQDAFAQLNSPRVRRGSSAKSRNATRFVFSRSTVLPFSVTLSQSVVDQLDTVVNASAWGSYVKGQRSRQTGGRMRCHSRPQSEKRADGVPTVSPVVR